MAGLKGSRLQDLTACVGPLLDLVACVSAGVHVFTRTTGCQGVAPICDLKRQSAVSSAPSILSLYSFRVSIVTRQLLPKSDSDRLIRPLGIRRSSW